MSQRCFRLAPFTGLLRFGTGDLEWVKAYIRSQREHHARGGCHDRLERIIRYDEAGERGRSMRD
jgi:hypothetical protein